MPGEEKTLFTFQGAFSGTVGYMSPEQYEGGTVTAASDQFSFCAALYEALYGYLPFEGLTAAEQSHSTRGPVRGPPADTQVPEEVFRILSRGMSPQPAGRYPSMAALLSALSVEHQQTAAAAAITRRRIQLAAILACIAMTVLVQYLSAKRARIHREAVGISLLLVSTFLTAGFVYRKALQRNAFHRRMWAHILIALLQNLCLRVLVASRGGVPFSVLFAVEMIIWLGATLSIATLTARSMRWLPGIPLVAASISLFFENPPRQVFLIFYPLILCSALWCWRKESLK